MTRSVSINPKLLDDIGTHTHTHIHMYSSSHLSLAAAASSRPNGRLKDAWVTVSSVRLFMVAHRSTTPGLGEASAS